ncbi:hypothetical protein [Yersinia phage fHe-Yen9-04]|uniref:Uncharacterized protein n=1 Tax=Yersinia phage fHe-Yen9-04 TaxID=2052742 RepID=A0A2C9CZA7_9CAUD|nr:hypothetical protein FDJ41_gp472 [Yersinia phage fHe-Yen9-04]SOK58708.1 hypothetical protein [Yersinia phage fHe-Yen9-04]VUE36477.1 hypothetical protein [Yersinia phage fHe-Yen9-04]
MKKFNYTTKNILVSPIIELVDRAIDYDYNNISYWNEVRERIVDNILEGVSLIWVEYLTFVLTIEISDPELNYSDKLDKAIDDLAGYCYDYECNIRIGGEIVKSD